MDPRRPPRGVIIDPKFRQVGFEPQHPPNPSAAASNSNSNSAAAFSSSSSPPVNSRSPVMIPPALAVDTSLPRPVPAPRRAVSSDTIPVGSYNPSDSLLATSPAYPSTGPIGRGAGEPEGEDEDESEGGVGSPSWYTRMNSGKFGPASLGFSMSGVNSTEEDSVAEASVPVKTAEPVPLVFDEKRKPALSDTLKGDRSNSKSLKGKTTKAERRALQEAQRAAKAEGKKSITGKVAVTGKTPAVQPTQKKEIRTVNPSPALLDKKGSDRTVEKDKKRDVPPPRMQYDDKKRVDKAKKRSIVKQTEVRNCVELFQHLPQYELGNQLQDLQAKSFNLDVIHPAVYKVGLQHLAGDLSGANARCIAMLLACKEVIKDYIAPAEKIYSRDLTARISSQISFLSECRPLSISMGNAIRFLKNRIAKLLLTLTEVEARTSICEDIDRFINEKILIAGKVIVGHAASKIRDGDVLLAFGCSSVVEMILLHAHELGKKFRVVIIDSRPKQDGQTLARRLVTKGLSCTYTHINAVSYIMPEVTLVLLGAAAVLSNGTAYSKIGTACVAMVANAFRVPVLFCCEAYKFHERVQLDSICSNELGDPDEISKVPGREDVNYLENWKDTNNLQLLNLRYDITPSDYISMIVTDYGMIPPTSVPVIVREYSKVHFVV